MKGFCDCNQCRLPCTCEDRIAQLLARNASNTRTFLENQENFISMMGSNAFYGTADIEVRTNRTYPVPPTTEYPSDRRKDPVQRFSIEAQLQLMKALALLGWAGFILKMMGV